MITQFVVLSYSKFYYYTMVCFTRNYEIVSLQEKLFLPFGCLFYYMGWVLLSWMLRIRCFWFQIILDLKYSHMCNVSWGWYPSLNIKFMYVLYTHYAHTLDFHSGFCITAFWPLPLMWGQVWNFSPVTCWHPKNFRLWNIIDTRFLN